MSAHTGSMGSRGESNNLGIATIDWDFNCSILLKFDETQLIILPKSFPPWVGAQPEKYGD